MYIGVWGGFDMDSALSDYKSMSDEQLVRSAKNDKKAVSELIVRYLRTVREDILRASMRIWSRKGLWDC